MFATLTIGIAYVVALQLEKATEYRCPKDKNKNRYR